jgi:hypothetical protein
MPFVVYDQLNDGYVLRSVMDGWVFTYLLSAATRFETKAEALAVVREHYSDVRGRLVIEEQPKGG